MTLCVCFSGKMSLSLFLAGEHLPRQLQAIEGTNLVPWGTQKHQSILCVPILWNHASRPNLTITSESFKKNRFLQFQNII